jgi:hypothetical protein
MKEARVYPRFKTTLEVSCAGYELQGIADGVMCNLSKRGSAVRSPFAVQPGAEVALYIHTPNDTTPIVIDLAKVCWVGRDEFGAEFLLIRQPNELRKLNRLLETLSNSGAGEA